VSIEKKTGNDSYRDILKSTSVIGGASLIKILVAAVRTKFIAVLIGPTGVGLLGTYSQILLLVGEISDMGLEGSGVRQIAEAVGTGDKERIARSVLTLRRMFWLTGGLGMTVLIVLCIPISWITFDSSAYALPIAFLSIIILINAIESGQGCILQGTRRINDIAKRNIISSVNGALISIPCFYFWGQKGIVPSLILYAIASLTTSWWFARRVSIKSVELSWSESRNEAMQLLKLGISFMGAGLAASLTGYLIRIILIRQFGFNDVGLYHAAYGLSGIVVGFVLNAMGTDYFPRLTAVSGDDSKVRRMINEQTEVSILLALPALAAMMVFAPLVIRIFYSESFIHAIPILRWNLFGVLGQVFSWPLGIVLLAKGKGRLYLFTELLLSAGHIFTIYFCLWFWGLNGTGIAFMITLFFYTVMMYFVVNRLIEPPWTNHIFKLVFLSSTVMAILMIVNSLNLNPFIIWGISIGILTPVTYICLQQLSKKSGISVASLLSRLKGKQH